GLRAARYWEHSPSCSILPFTSSSNSSGLETNRMMQNIISVDVEEYFHPSELQKYINADQWSSLPSLVEPQTRRVLELFERRRVRGTFFVLGWVATRHPRLVREIAAAGHEIGCHSYAH